MERVEYQVRGNLFENERKLALTEHELWIEEESKAPLRIELSSISEIRLVFAPTRAQTNRYQCTLTAAGNPHHFINMHFRGLLDFEDRGPAYAAFCRELCARAKKRNSMLRCVGGHTPLRYYLTMALALAAIIGFIALVIAFWEIISARFSYWLRSLLLIVMMFSLIHYARANRPQKLDPDRIPDEVLPKSA